MYWCLCTLVSIPLHQSCKGLWLFQATLNMKTKCGWYLGHTHSAVQVSRAHSLHHYPTICKIGYSTCEDSSQKRPSKVFQSLISCWLASDVAPTVKTMECRHKPEQHQYSHYHGQTRPLGTTIHTNSTWKEMHRTVDKRLFVEHRRKWLIGYIHLSHHGLWVPSDQRHTCISINIHTALEWGTEYWWR